MADSGASLVTAFDYVWGRLTDRLVGLSHDEYFWEPVGGCWSLRQGDDGRWRLDGGGGGGPAPEPVPVTTIAWRIGHLAGLGLAGFTDRLFGESVLTADAIDYPATVGSLPEFLDQQYQAWRAGLIGLDGAGWRRPLGSDWGPYAQSTTFDLALHLFDEIVHHGAEVGLLRDLYQHRADFASSNRSRCGTASRC